MIICDFNKGKYPDLKVINAKYDENYMKANIDLLWKLATNCTINTLNWLQWVWSNFLNYDCAMTITLLWKLLTNNTNKSKSANELTSPTTTKNPIKEIMKRGEKLFFQFLKCCFLKQTT